LQVQDSAAQRAEAGGGRGFFGGVFNQYNQYNTTLNYQAGSTSKGLGDAKASLLKVPTSHPFPRPILAGVPL
jgi:hypothetical protein